MKKQKNKQAKKASKLAKAENLKQKTITVKNAEGEPDTEAVVLVQNKIDYTPKVSVIIPVYNVEQYLRECLNSVIKQTLKEIEIICVDDGSTDNSLDILREYAEKDHRITIITQKNLHAGVARNAGLAIAKGEYLSFLDSDDFFELNMLEETYNLAKKENTEIVFYQYKKYNNETRKIEQTEGINILFPTNKDGYSVQNTKDIADKLFTICNPMPWNKLLKHSFITDEQIYFQSLKASNDVYFSLVAIACANKIALLYKPYVYYRHNRKDSLKNNRDKAPLNFYDAYKAIYQTLRHKNIYETYQTTFLNSLMSSAIWTVAHTDKARSMLKTFVQETIIPEFGVEQNQKRFSNWMQTNIKRLCQPELIVSLTSFPARIGTVNQTIESLLNQTVKADKVILWLAPEQFPNKEADLPQQLLDLKEKGLTIDWYHDIRSYKKLIPTLKKYPDAIIVTADDDIIYAPNCLDCLYKTYLNNFHSIVANRITRLYQSSENIKIFPRIYYKDDAKDSYRDNLRKANIWNMQTGCGAVLYPAHCFAKDILNENLIKKLAPTNDDQWFWAMGALNGYYVTVPEKNLYNVKYVPGSQDGECLWKINDRGDKLYFKDLNKIIQYYPEIKKMLDVSSKANNRIIQHIIDNYSGAQDFSSVWSAKIENWYYKSTGKFFNINNSQTYNEKLQWLKIYNALPIKTRLADKYLVRDWVKEKIGEQYLIPLLGVYDKFEDIDFAKLPNQFVIKCNHGSGWNIIVSDKSKLDLDDAKAKLDRWIDTNFAFKYGYELHYRDIEPKIIIEKYIDPQVSNHEIQVWCFNGKIQFVSVESIKDTNNLVRGTFYPDGTRTKFEISPQHYKKLESIPSMKAFNKALELAKKMLIDVPYVRIDFIDYKDDVRFREMTFTSGSGLSIIKPDKYNIELGRMIKLPKLAYNLDTGEYYKLPKKSRVLAWLELPFNFLRVKCLQHQFNKLQVKQIYKQLSSFRVDAKNFGTADNALVVIAPKTKVSTPAWFANAQGKGSMIEGSELKQSISLKAIKSGKLQLTFKGPDRRANNVRYPLWIDYKSIKIDGKEILSSPVATWHDKPFKYEMPVKDGQVVKIAFKQQPHQYAKSELKDVILKLNPNNNYIKTNIDKIVTKVATGIGYIPEMVLSQFPKIKADSFISLGVACRPAYWLQLKNLRQYALPFDWLMNYKLTDVISVLKNYNGKLFSQFNEDKNMIGKKYRYVKDTATGMVAMHAFPITTSVEKYLPEFNTVFNRRLVRFRTVCSNSENICFVSNRNYSLSDLITFGEQLHQLYQNLQIVYINVCNQKTKTEIKRYNINKYFTIYNIIADDVNERGATKEINPQFWLGNEYLWNSICNNFTLTGLQVTGNTVISPEEVERQKVLNLLQQSLAASQTLSKEISNLKGQIESLQKEVKTLKTEQVTTQKMLVNEQTLLQKRRKLN